MKLQLIVFGIAIATYSCSSPSSKSAEAIDLPDSTALYYKGSDLKKPAKKVVFICGDEEYRSEEGMPMMAEILATHHGFNCKVLFSQDSNKLGIINPNYHYNIPKLEEIKDADLVVLFTRFRALPDEQMKLINNYLVAGKPIIGIRTATHAFEFSDTLNKWNHYSNSFSDKDSPWDGGFGRLVLGEKWVAHHGHHKHQSTRGISATGAQDHPILNGIGDGIIWGSTDVYRVRLPMVKSAQAILLGEVIDREGDFMESDVNYGLRETDQVLAKKNSDGNGDYDPNNPKMPIAWINNYKLPNGTAGTSFTSTIGSSTDLMNEGVRRLLVNAVYYLLALETPESADVTLPENYRPNAYGFHSDEYWLKKNLSVQDIN